MNDPDDPTFQTQTQPIDEPSDTERRSLGDSASHATEPTATGARLREIRVKGYRITSEIARGGMGVVLAAREIELDREVAIKVMLDTRRSSGAILRFVRESKITARLGHPGIPPVHSMGLLDDGSPYLAMKLVHGKTLADLLKERENPLVELPRFVQIFEQIAQAVGFAHSKGVVHRDLKPANVMVGEFGEVQVMDWGIAKVLNGSDVTEPGGDTRFDEGKTEFGLVIGTPAYLPPEQARGESVDARADVFALGAILSVILTNKAPFADGTSSDEVIRWSAAGDLKAAMTRLEESACDPELVALAKRCLAPNANDRPSHAREVADAVAAYRADVELRLQDAEKRRVAAEAKTVEQRKRRRVVMIAGLIVCFTLLAGSIVAGTQAFRASRAEAKTREQLKETELARQEAETASEQAKVRYLLALGAFDEMINAIQNKLATRPGTLDIRKELLTGARFGLKKLQDEAEKQGNPDRLLLGSHFQMGKIETTLGNHKDARREFEIALAMAKSLVGANPTDKIAQSDLSVALSHLVDDAMARNEADRAREFLIPKIEIDRQLVRDDPMDVRWQRLLGHCLRQMGAVDLYQNRKDQARQNYQERLDLFLKLAKTNPNDVVIQREFATSYELMGDVCGYQEKPKEALQNYQLALVLIRKILEGDPRDLTRQRSLLVICTRIGNLYEDLFQPEEAAKYYEECSRIQQVIVAADPLNDKAKTDLFITYVNLGNVDVIREDFAKAKEWFRKASDVIKPLHEQKKLVGQFANAYSNSEGQIRGCDEYLNALKDLDFVLKKKPLKARELLEYRIRVFERAKDRPGMLASAEAFDKLIVSEPKFAVPAAIAWCRIGESEKADAKFRDQCATKAIALLKASTLGDKPAFKPSELLDGIQKDKSFAWLLNRDDGKAFLKTLGKP